jgi:hypothetical protein
MAKQRPWQIRVGRKAQIIAEFSVPAHKLQKNALEAFLRSVVVRYRTNNPEEMLGYYVSKTRGRPSRLGFAELSPAYDLDRRLVGYFCSDWECYADAMREIDADHAESLKRILEENKRSKMKP